MSSHTRRVRRTALLLPALAAALALGACAGSGGSESDSSAADAPAAAAAPDNGGAAERHAAESADLSAVASGDLAYSTTSGGTPVKGQPEYAQKAVISTGSISLRSDDVAKTKFDVQTVIDDHGGQTSDEKTETGDDGKVTRSRLVFRVPVAEFSDTMEALEGTAELVSSSSGSEDVTTQVIDTAVRIRAQEKSIERIEVLYSRAQSIRDIMAIEAQLQRRQADLDSLKQQQAYLADQTSMSTITVHLQLKPEKKVAKPAKDDTGFIAGLTAGWHGLKRVTTGAATALGALLPFAVVLLVLGIPGWIVTRRMLAQRAATPVVEPSPAES